MIIRPLDVPVMIPRTTDVAKIASVIDQSSATQQQQIAAQQKLVANERQQQVKNPLQKEHAGTVTTEDLNQQKQKERHGSRNEDEPSGDADHDAKPLPPADPVRGHTIDIKT